MGVLFKPFAPEEKGRVTNACACTDLENARHWQLEETLNICATGSSMPLEQKTWFTLLHYGPWKVKGSCRGKSSEPTHDLHQAGPHGRDVVMLKNSVRTNPRLLRSRIWARRSMNVTLRLL